MRYKVYLRIFGFPTTFGWFNIHRVTLTSFLYLRNQLNRVKVVILSTPQVRRDLCSSVHLLPGREMTSRSSYAQSALHRFREGKEWKKVSVNTWFLYSRKGSYSNHLVWLTEHSLFTQLGSDNELWEESAWLRMALNLPNTIHSSLSPFHFNSCDC